MSTGRAVGVALPVATVLALASVPMRLGAQSGLETLPVQGSVFALMTPGGNTTVQIGARAPSSWTRSRRRSASACSTAIRSLTPRPIRHIVLTSGSDQSAGGAANLSKAGRYIRVIDSIDPRGIDARASIIAHLNVLNRMTAAQQPSASWPTDTYFTPEWALFSNGEAVQFIHVPAAHSDGDTIVFFRRSDVVSTGAIFDAAAYPQVRPRRAAAASTGSSKG